MNIKVFLINLLFGCITLGFVFFNLFAFYSTFADQGDSNLLIIAIDVIWILGIGAYNIISAKRRGVHFRDIVINIIVPFALPFIIALCILIAEGQSSRNKIPATLTEQQ